MLEMCPQTDMDDVSSSPCGANQEGQMFGNFTASHFANAAFTATGHSCAIQWPDGIVTSVRSLQYWRIGSAKREPPVVRQVTSLTPSRNKTGMFKRPPFREVAI